MKMNTHAMSHIISQPLNQPPFLDGIKTEEFRYRREMLKAALPEGIIILRGATEEEVVTGQRYHQNSPFVYYTGIETPGAFLVLLPAGLSSRAGNKTFSANVEEILFLPERNPTGETWTGQKLGPGTEAETLTGIAKVAPVSSLWTALTGWLRRCPLVYTLCPFGETAKLTREFALMQRIFDLAPSTRFQDCARAMRTQRLVKSPAEIEKLEAAICISEEGQKAAKKAITEGAGRYEYEVEAKVLEAFRSRGATLAFPAIIGSGFRATVLHYEDNHEKMNEGDLVVVDIGAKLNGYNGDLTRTYPVGGSGTLSARQREIYALVLEAHRLVIDSFVVGVDSRQSLDDRVKELLDKSSLRSKDAKGEEKTMKTFMPHGLGHHLGLDVHDVVAQDDLSDPLPVGSVFTVEPGVYLPSESIGVRLEDDYLVTETGLKRLGAGLPLELDTD